MWICEDELLEALVNSGLHGQCWPKHVYGAALHTVSGNNVCYMAKNTSRTQHAEDDVLDYLEELLEDMNLEDQQIVLFLSASPCQRCSHRIIDFLEGAWRHHNVQLRMKIVCSAFYRVRRPSCERNPRCRNHLPTDEDHRSQLRGLWTLYCTPGVDLRTFCHRDWLHLERALGVFHINFRGRKSEDDLIRKDFQQIMVSCSMRLNYVFPIRSCSFRSRVNLSTNKLRKDLPTNQLKMGLSTNQPLVDLSSQRRASLLMAQPQVGLSNDLLHEGLSNDLSHEGMSIAQPQEGLSNYLPDEGLFNDLPHEVLSNDLPHEGMIMAQPHEDLSNDLLHEGLSNDVPHQDLSNDQLHEDLSNDLPHQDLSNDLPHQDLSNDQLHEDLSNDLPHEGMLMAQPQEGLSNDLLQEGVSNDLLDESMSNDLPHEGMLMAQPQGGQIINEMSMSLSSDHRRKKLSADQSCALFYSNRSSTFNFPLSMFSLFCFIIIIVFFTDMVLF